MAGRPSADAFDLLPVLPSVDSGRAKIRALGVFGEDHMYVGTDDGRVLLHTRPPRTVLAANERDERGAEGVSEPPEASLVLDQFELMREKFLGRKKDVIQLHVFGDLNRVVCLVEGGYLDVLHMVTLEIMSPGVPQNKNVAMFVAESGVPVYRLAVITAASRTKRRSRLFIYEFASSAVGFEPVCEPIDLPEQVFCVEFFRGTICFGFFGKNRKEYRLLNVDTLAETELFPLDMCKAPPHVRVVGEELLLVRDELGLFIEASGALVTSHNNIVWTR
jgi:CNH domain